MECICCGFLFYTKKGNFRICFPASSHSTTLFILKKKAWLSLESTTSDEKLYHTLAMNLFIGDWKGSYTHKIGLTAVACERLSHMS